MAWRWPFSKRKSVCVSAPDFIEIAERKTRAQLEKSCGRELEEAWSRRSETSGERVRQFFLRSEDLQRRYSLGLLPIGQKRLGKWLLKEGRVQHNFHDAEILSFLLESSANLPAALAQTYLITPEWQQRFPDPAKLLPWLREQWPDWATLREVKTWPIPATPVPLPQCGANLLAHFCYPSGLQQGALAAKAALEAVGVPLSCRDVPVGTKTELWSRDPWLGREIYPISLMIMSPVPYTETCYERAGLYRRPDVYRIAYWSWELDTIPAEWPTFAGLFDEIWTPTEFVATAMRTRFNVPIFAMPHPLLMPNPEPVSRAELGVAEDHFVFLFMFDMCSELERKNPLGLIRAFRRAFAPHEKATLLLKVVRAELDASGFAELQEAAKGANIVVVNDLATRARALGYIALADCYVSLHRSEGFGLTLAEAMSVGKPVIATNYSGNVDFMNGANSWLVDYKMVPIQSDGPIYKTGGRWAHPSEEHAAQMMREVWEDSAAADARAARGQAEINRQLAPVTIGSRMKRRLEEIARAR